MLTDYELAEIINTVNQLILFKKPKNTGVIPFFTIVLLRMIQILRITLEKTAPMGSRSKSVASPSTAVSSRFIRTSSFPR